MTDQHYFGIVSHVWFGAAFLTHGERMLVSLVLGVIFMAFALV